MAQIVCKDVVLGYEGKAVVQNLNFEVNKGDYLCIVGENGSGKSTLIRAMLRLKEPMSGEICMDDGLETDGIGYLPQQTVVQKDFPASVQEIVRSGCLGAFWVASVLQEGRKREGGRKHGEARHCASGKTLLPGVVRGPAAESSAGKSALCNQIHAASG